MKTLVELFDTVESKDGLTWKSTVRLQDGFEVETMRTERPSKYIVCFPSQVGCKRHCMFCKAQSFQRNLTPNEIEFLYTCMIHGLTDKPILASCMGEGEPSDNPDIIVALERLLMYTKRLAVSTSGLHPSFFSSLNVLSDHLKVQLSLHATNDDVHRTIKGVGYPCIRTILESFIVYRGSKEVNYVLVEGVNDFLNHARQLAELVRYYHFNVKINQLQHPTILPSRRQKEFVAVLRDCGVDCEEYKTDGFDIQASCGMMTYRKHQ